MRNLSRYRQGRHEGYQSSEEILAAIEAVSGADLPYDGMDYSPDDPAYRLWADPLPKEVGKVARIAWELADPETSALHWGAMTVTREV